VEFLVFSSPIPTHEPEKMNYTKWETLTTSVNQFANEKQSFPTTSTLKGPGNICTISGPKLFHNVFLQIFIPLFGERSSPKALPYLKCPSHWRIGTNLLFNRN
jgi:hypothetical protein